MASIRDAIGEYRPELTLEKPLPPDEAIAFLVEKSGVDEATVRKVLAGIAELAFWHLLRGRPVPLPGVGHIKPAIRLDGTYGAILDLEPELAKRMGEPEAYRGGVKRRENIGLSLARLAQMWNSGHPNDPVTDQSAYSVANSG